MLKKILRVIFTAIGIVLGFMLSNYLLNNNYFSGSAGLKVVFIIFITVFFGFILYLISPIINSIIIKTMEHIEKSTQKMSITEVIAGAIGAITGLIISSFIVGLFSGINVIGLSIAIVIDVVMAALGAEIAIKKREDLMLMFSNLKKAGNVKEKKLKTSYIGDAKILDTSVIIDGRIFDICQTGFIEGSLIIPNFVLDELRHIADSSDNLKRNRGRRGLDILNKIQKELSIDVQIYEKDFPDIAEVDSKLLKLAQLLNGKVVTNDYNLNKVAEVHGVAVLNINELANAVKPVVLPGEEMKILIIKDGKESGQGVAYLDDGTMIVVEGGRKFIGETKDVVVTSVLQTAAGRMIFAKQKELLES